MKLTKNGYRISKNGNPIKSFESDSLVETVYKGQCIKLDGGYYFYDRKQGESYVYLP